MRAPGWDVEDLETRAREGGGERAPEPSRVLDPDNRSRSAAVDEPVDEFPIALGRLANSSVATSPPRSSISAAACRCLWQSMPTNNLEDLLVAV
jgi:hypothetical protein